MDKQTYALQLAGFMDLFSGDNHNYGVHQYMFEESGKEKGKNFTAKNKLLTAEQYQAHLAGETGLGIIPIDQKGEVKFAVIDIDVYDKSFDLYLQAIERAGFPFVPFRSKSGGLHLYTFFEQAINAKAAIEVTRAMSAMLGLDLYVKNKLNRILEIFPKQTRADGKDVGSWINLPYYNASNTRQYSTRSGKQLTLDEAIAYAKSKRTTLAEIQRFLKELAGGDGPPCLQTIRLLGHMSEGMGRNNYLFSIGVYYKKSDPEFWEQSLFEANNAMAKPLPRDELEATVINSLRKKDYAYKCKEAPCVDFCRKSDCKKREYGIGKDGGYFSEVEFGPLVQIKAFEPYYEWQVRLHGDEKFVVMRFKNEADIIGQDSFLRMCVRDLHRLPVKIKQSEWYKLINQALADMKIIEVDQDDDTAPIGLLRMFFIEFLTERAPAQTKEQLLSKRAYLDEQTGTYYFRTGDLSEFLFITKNFRFFTPSDLHGILRDFKAKPTRIKTERGKQLRVYEISRGDLLRLGEARDEPFKAKFGDKEDF